MAQDYPVRDFLKDCYLAAEKQGAYGLTGEDHTKACIQAFRYVLNDAYKFYGERAVLKIASSFNMQAEMLYNGERKPVGYMQEEGSGNGRRKSIK